MTRTQTLLGLALGFLSISSPVSAKPLRARQGKSSCGSKPTLDLAPCPAESGLGDAFECGFLAAPIDHDNPGGNNTFDLWVSRRKANGTAGSQGTLFFNNGGPGAASSYVWQLLALGQPLFSQRLLETFDIVAIDPRGIGQSTPIQCDHDLWNNAPKAYATDDDSFAALVDFNQKFSASCEQLTGPLFNFLDTVSTVKDYDLVREALGVDKIHFVGYSYGTLQGQVYAELFPERVGRFVWDGLTDHTSFSINTFLIESVTYETTLKQFFSWCNTTSDCALQGQDVAGIFANLSSAESLPAPSLNDSSFVVRGEDVLANSQLGLAWFDSLVGTWAGFSEGLKAAAEGDAAALARTIQTDNFGGGAVDGVFANRATMCQDWGSYAKSAADIRRYVDAASAQTPIVKGSGQGFSTIAYCAGWSAPVRFPARPLDQTKMAKLPPVLLVNALYDPETSAVWAEAVRQQTPTGVNIWRNGAGHTSYLLYGETMQAMDEFLISGTLPEDGQIFQS